MSEEIRHRILDAAQRVYAQYGFRGATTRLIATEADVNEVTLFRTFGSKAQLLQEMLRTRATGAAAPALPDDVDDPESAITAWCVATLHHLRGNGQVIRKTIAEAEERPEAACQACEGSNAAAESLAVYVERLREEGLADTDADVEVAISMLISTLFGDALYRDIIPNSFPQPAEEAPRRYVRTFLRAVGCRASALPDRSRPARVAASRRSSR
jgi:AcrR family transcriptional regulator